MVVTDTQTTPFTSVDSCNFSCSSLVRKLLKLSPASHEGVWGRRLIPPLIFNLDNRWWEFNFMIWTLDPRGKSRLYSLNRRLVGPQRRSGRFGERIHLLLLQEIGNPFLGFAVKINGCRGTGTSIPLLTEYQTMKTYRAMKVQRHAFLTSALDECKLSSLPVGRFAPGIGMPLPTGQEATWIPQPVWTLCLCQDSKPDILPVTLLTERSHSIE